MKFALAVIWLSIKTAAIAQFLVVLAATGAPEPLHWSHLLMLTIAVCGASGGFAGWRETLEHQWPMRRNVAEIALTAGTTACMGIVIVLALSAWTLESRTYGLAVIGVSGGLSLGGLSGADFARRVFQRFVNEKFGRPKAE